MAQQHSFTSLDISSAAQYTPCMYVNTHVRLHVCVRANTRCKCYKAAASMFHHTVHLKLYPCTHTRVKDKFTSVSLHYQENKTWHMTWI